LPTISVIIPVKNGSDYIAEAVQSMLDQDLADIEVIVIDDGSSDDSVAIVKSMGNRDARIRIFINPGSGIVDALNTGISVARAPLSARMDSDDVSLPNRLSLQVEQFQADPDLQLLGTAGLCIDEAGRLLGHIDVPCDDHEIRDAFSKHNPMLHPTVMFRTDAVRRAGGYRRAFTYAEDYDLWIRLSKLGRIANMKAALVKLRTHPAQTSKIKRDQQKAAAALARQSAALRHDRNEPFDENGQPADAINAFLTWRAGDRRGIASDECRDIELMLRTPGLSSALTRKVLLRAAIGAPSFSTLTLAPRLAWHRMEARLAAFPTAKAGSL